MAKQRFQHVLAHWGTLIEGFQTSSLEFYAAVESALQRREVPEIRLTRVTNKESGVLSAKREYLRVSRRRLLFDICAAPFGTSFFFSWWQATPPLRFGIPFGLVLLGVEYGVCTFILRFTPIRNVFFFPILPDRYQLMGSYILIALLFFLLLCAIARTGMRWLEDLLLPIPIAGAIYRRFFRPVTYYELDTEAMYRTTVHAAVLEIVDGLTKARGMRALAEDQRKPIMREFFGR